MGSDCLDTDIDVLENIDSSLFELLDVFDKALIKKNKEFEAGLYEHFKERVSEGLDVIRVKKKYCDYIPEVSLPIYSVKSNSKIEQSISEGFFKFRDDFKKKNSAFYGALNYEIYFDVYYKLSEVIEQVIDIRFIDSDDSVVCCSDKKLKIDVLKGRVDIYNSAVNEMTNLFVNSGILELEDVVYLYDTNIETSKVDEFNNLLSQSNTEQKDLLRGYLNELYVNLDKMNSWGIMHYREHPRSANEDSLIGRMYNLNMPDRHYLPVLKKVFEDLGFCIELDNDDLVYATMDSKEFYGIKE